MWSGRLQQMTSFSGGIVAITFSQNPMMIVGGLIVSACGCWILYGLFSQLINAVRSRRWTGRATGIIVQRGRERLEFPGRGNEARHFKVAALEYEYEVAGETYRSRNIAFTPYVGGPDSRRGKLIATLDPGRPVDVVHNESRPGEAVLYPGFEALETVAVLLGLFTAVFFLGVGVIMLLGFAD